VQSDDPAPAGEGARRQSATAGKPQVSTPDAANQPAFSLTSGGEAVTYLVSKSEG
jgi:hypothetical protein